jgi:hypothetical protein
MLFIDDLLLAPITGFQFILRTLAKVAEEQYTDDAPLKEELLNLQMRLDEGEISEDEYTTEEARILRRLREIQERKMELAGVDIEAARQPMDASAAGRLVVDTAPQYTDREER